MNFRIFLICSIVGAPVIATAQSSVTLYGVADAGVEYTNRTPAGSLQRVVSGGEAGSRFGFRGAEDLGSGLKAQFVLEGGINIDTGTSAQGGALFGRSSYVGISGEFGQLTLGRQPSMSNEFVLAFEPLGRPARYSSPTLDAAYVARIDNSLRYGFSAGSSKLALMYGAGEVTGSSRANRYYGASGTTAFGPLTLGAAYDKQAGSTLALQNDATSRTSVSAQYTFGLVSALAGYTHRKNATAALPGKTDQYWIGARANLSPSWYVAAAYYRSDAKNSSSDASMLSGFLSYALSKRSDVYAHLAVANNKGNANMGVTGFGTTTPGGTQTGITIGMRHTF